MRPWWWCGCFSPLLCLTEPLLLSRRLTFKWVHDWLVAPHGHVSATLFLLRKFSTSPGGPKQWMSLRSGQKRNPSYDIERICQRLTLRHSSEFLWLQIPSLFKLLSYWFDGCQKVLSPLKVFSHQAAADVFSTYRGTVWLNPPFAKPTEAHEQFDFPSTQLYRCSFSVSQDV